ncbi:MAG: hypothetical protein R3D30_03600 [Hyphomicrobiales bacterium]
MEFDAAAALDDRLTLHPTASVSGNVFAGGGTDTLAFGGRARRVNSPYRRRSAVQDFETFQVKAALELQAHGRFTVKGHVMGTAFGNLPQWRHGGRNSSAHHGATSRWRRGLRGRGQRRRRAIASSQRHGEPTGATLRLAQATTRQAPTKDHRQTEDAVVGSSRR